MGVVARFAGASEAVAAAVGVAEVAAVAAIAEAVLAAVGESPGVVEASADRAASFGFEVGVEPRLGVTVRCFRWGVAVVVGAVHPIMARFLYVAYLFII